MNIFKKRETLISNIAFMGIVSAINIICILMSLFMPALIFVLVFILPLVSTFVTLLCKKAYYPIYVVVTLAISLFVNIPDTLFYIMPSLFTGFVIGFLLDKGKGNGFIILCTTLVQVLLSCVGVIIYKQVTGISIPLFFLSVIGLSNSDFVNSYESLYILIVSFIQIVVTYIVVLSQAKKLNLVTMRTTSDDTDALCLAIAIVTTVQIVMFFFLKQVVLFFFVLDAIIGIYLSITLFFEKTLWINLSIAGSFIGSFFLFAALYNFIESPFQVITLSLFNLLIGIIVLINNYLHKKAVR